MSFPVLAYEVPDSTIVYVTKHGEKYHREGCSYLKSIKETMTIEEAEEQGYGPCSRCDPDTTTGLYKSKDSGKYDGSSNKNKASLATLDDVFSKYQVTEEKKQTNGGVGYFVFFLLGSIGIYSILQTIRKTFYVIWIYGSFLKSC